MEPLSVAASVLAVLGAASAAGRGLQHVLALRNAPDQVIALINEVSVFVNSQGRSEEVFIPCPGQRPTGGP